jgi:aerobic carbon-monoxide dehydrogenase small subunit
VIGRDDPDEVTITLDGERTVLVASATTSLLRALRDGGHTATTGACEQGECGSCSVLLDGRLECSCLVPALVCDGADVRTVRSSVRPDLAAAFAEHGAVQCGFCTPGIVVAAEAALAGPAPLSASSTREALAGNLCRCTGYEAIVAAVVEVDRRRRDGGA